MAASSEHRWAVDSIEEGVARVEEDGQRMISVSAKLLPPGAKEGDVLRAIRTGERVEVSLDEAATRAAMEQSRATVEAAARASKARDPGGDVSL